MALNSKTAKMVANFPKIIGTGHICQTLGLSSSAVYQLLKKKAIDGWLAGRVWMIRKEDFIKFLDTYTEPGHAPAAETIGDINGYYEKEFSGYPDIVTTGQIKKMLNASNKYVLKRLGDGRIKSFMFGRSYRAPKQSVIDYAATEDHQSDRRKHPRLK